MKKNLIGLFAIATIVAGLGSITTTKAYKGRGGNNENRDRRDYRENRPGLVGGIFGGVANVVDATGNAAANIVRAPFDGGYYYDKNGNRVYRRGERNRNNDRYEAQRPSRYKR